MGLVALLVPNLATLVATGFIAATIAVWGGLGLWMSFALRPSPKTGLSAVAFGLPAALGGLFLALPGLGMELLTMLVASLLAEGIPSIVYGLRISTTLPGGPTGDDRAKAPAGRTTPHNGVGWTAERVRLHP